MGIETTDLTGVTGQKPADPAVAHGATSAPGAPPGGDPDAPADAPDENPSAPSVAPGGDPDAPAKPPVALPADPPAAGRAPAGDPSATFRIALPSFEGPLDLLLHLIREHKIDIFDIPIALITEKYLAALKVMKELDLDVAGEFVLMAATLLHIKSRMLLPNPEPLPDEEVDSADPREELVRRLLNYQKYKAAADELARQDLLDREVFTRRARSDRIPLDDNEIGLVEVSVFKLVEGLSRVLEAARLKAPHQVFMERMSIGEAITGLMERLRDQPKTSCFTLLEGVVDQQRILVTFLALLEMAKLGLIGVHQEEAGGDIFLWARDRDALERHARFHAGFKDDYR